MTRDNFKYMGWSHKNVPSVGELCSQDQHDKCKRYGYCIQSSSYAVKTFAACRYFQITYDVQDQEPTISLKQKISRKDWTDG